MLGEFLQSGNEIIEEGVTSNTIKFNLKIAFSELQTGDSFPKSISKALIMKNIICSKIFIFKKKDNVMSFINIYLIQRIILYSENLAFLSFVMKQNS